jgi:hypothetical protein
MPAEPTVKPLSHGNRKLTFWFLLVVFVVAMPVFLFYAMGYRIDFANNRSIITVGGLYIGASATDVLMYVDEKPVTDMRIFQRAAYIQNVDAGMHRVHVQKAGLTTWVKELPVYPHIVTEAEAFNLPVVPQVRYIPAWLTDGGLPVLIEPKGKEPRFLTVASTTNTIVATTSAATRTYTANSEHAYIETLFASSTEPTTRRAVDISITTPHTQVATTTKRLRDAMLFEEEGDVYVRWTGSNRNIPYYYCVFYTTPATTTAEYGEHVYEALLKEFGTTLDFSDPTVMNTRICRSEIRIDRKAQTVRWFDFVPGDMHHVLMLLDDGLYVVEADDRAWQNVELLYPGKNLEALVDGGRIYVKDGDSYLEVYTEIAS